MDVILALARKQQREKNTTKYNKMKQTKIQERRKVENGAF